MIHFVSWFTLACPFSCLQDACIQVIFFACTQYLIRLRYDMINFHFCIRRCFPPEDIIYGTFSEFKTVYFLVNVVFTPCVIFKGVMAGFGRIRNNIAIQVIRYIEPTQACMSCAWLILNQHTLKHYVLKYSHNKANHAINHTVYHTLIRGQCIPNSTIWHNMSLSRRCHSMYKLGWAIMLVR